KSVGDNLPLYEGETSAVRLTNRRVSIEVISPNSDSDTSINRNPTAGGAL
ncbi:OmpA family protein, partial [Vibrio parahaemolyticus]|nr:OmpA family protein [Vibrio parahaemolyticus]